MKQRNVLIFMLLLILLAGIGCFSYLQAVFLKVDYALIGLFLFWGVVFLKGKLLNDGSRIYKASIFIAHLSLICFATGFGISAYKRLAGRNIVEILWSIFGCLVMLLYFIWSYKQLASVDKNSQVQKTE